MSTSTLGFVGLGRMGGPMSGRLVAAGYEVVGFDVAGTAERLPPGAAAATSVADVARRADVVCLSLPDGAASRAVCGEIGAAAGRRATTVVDFSTIGIPAARDCAETLGAAGVGYLDAPVSGGLAGARQGTLAVMVGASEDAFAAVEPLLAVVAANCFRVGDRAGQGQAMKLANNFLGAVALAATSEAALFGVQQGLDLRQMIAVLNVSSGKNGATLDKFPRSVVPGTYDYGFAAALMAKDVTLYQESAAAAGTPDDLGELAAATWQRFDAACPGVDFTYIYEWLKGGSGA